jgi:serine O-acetyltransferase
MQRVGVCGAERTESELARDIWVQVREEAIGAVEHDRAMSEIIRDTVLIHDNFGDALAHRLARKLGDYALSIESLEATFCEAFAADPGIEEAALADLTAVRDRDPACPDLLTPFLFFKGYQALQAYRFAHWLWKRGRLHLAKHLQSRAAEVFAVDIHPAARLGQGILIDHGTAVVVGETAVIDDDVSILQGVTLGGTDRRRRQNPRRHYRGRRGQDRRRQHRAGRRASVHNRGRQSGARGGHAAYAYAGFDHGSELAGAGLYDLSGGSQQEGGGSFLKKRIKKLLLVRG